MSGWEHQRRGYDEERPVDQRQGPDLVPPAIPISMKKVMTTAMMRAVLALAGDESLYMKYTIQASGKKKKHRQPSPAESLSGALSW